MTEKQIESTRRTCVEDGDLLKEGPPALAPEQQSRQWAKQIATVFEKNRGILLHGVVRTIGIGAFMSYVRDEGKRRKIIPHGHFGPWLEKNCPMIPSPTAYRWMDLAAQTVGHLQNSHGENFEGDGFLFLSRAALGNGHLSKPELALREKLEALIEGKTQKQLFLEFKTVEEAPTGEVVVVHGGDRVWDAFIRKKHPELIVNGKVPKRGRVDQAVRDEFAASAPKPKPPSAEELGQDARIMLAEWLQVTRSLIAYEHLPMLMPQEFTAPMALLETLRAKLKMLHGRYRKPAPRKRKKAPAPDVLLPDTRRAIKASVIEGRKNEQSNRAPALAERAA